MTLLVTGATGFVGRACVAEARRRGHRVHALLRDTTKVPAEWSADPDIKVFAADLGRRSTTLDQALDQVHVVIHTAAAMTGSDEQLMRDTAGATQTLLEALQALTQKPRLVLVSSMALYDGGSLTPGDCLTEAHPLESQAQLRDGYTRAKLKQEALCMAAAREQGFELWSMRAGAIFGPGRIWNAHMGPMIGPLLLRMGADGELPLSYIEHTVAALLAAAERPSLPSLAVQVVNVLDDDRPTRSRFLSALKGRGGPAWVMPLPWQLLDGLSGMCGFLGGRVPGLLRRPAVRSRVMPLRYSAARQHQLLGQMAQVPFEEAMRRSLAGTAP